MFIGVPIAFSIELAGAFFLMITDLRPLLLVAQRMVVGANSFPLLAIPLFVLTGTLMDRGGLSKRLVDWSDTLVGGFSGGLGLVMVVSCAVFAALTGSGPATVAAIGAILIPSMVERGYAKHTAAGLAAAAGALGPIIPPSIPMVIYGVTVGLSISKLFVAGFLPGLLIAVMLMVVNVFIARRQGVKKVYRKFNFIRFLKATFSAITALLLPVIMLGGIYTGIFTPTEAGTVGVIYSLFVTSVIHRELGLKELKEALVSAIDVSCMVMFIIANSSLLGWIMSATQVPVFVADTIVRFVHTPATYLLLLNALLLVVGAVMDTVAAIIILAPILVPIGLNFGIDPLHLGLVFVVNLVFGYVTPPFGYNLFTAGSMAKLSTEEIVKGVWPFLCVEIVALLVLSYVPQISLWLPNLLYK
jgi:C4-dicarboxylate transporter DctM subunit